jgi:hypothetical protein
MRKLAGVQPRVRHTGAWICSTSTHVRGLIQSKYKLETDIWPKPEIDPVNGPHLANGRCKPSSDVGQLDYSTIENQTNQVHSGQAHVCHRSRWDGGPALRGDRCRHDCRVWVTCRNRSFAWQHYAGTSFSIVCRLQQGSRTIPSAALDECNF